MILTKKEKYAIVDTIAKKRCQPGTIFTPFELIEEIVDNLPVQWDNPNLTFFDPACGRGGFLFVIKQKLLEVGHSEQHIIEHMLYGIDIAEPNVVVTRAIVNPSGKYKPNIECCDAIKKDFEMKKFDVIVGNPPYQDATNDGVKIYKKFIKKICEESSKSSIIAMITPNTWLNYGDYITEAIKLKHVAYVNTRSDYIKKTYFKDIGTTFCWFILTSKGYLTDVETEANIIKRLDIKSLTFVPTHNTASKTRLPLNDTTLSILNKFITIQQHGINYPYTFVTTGGVGTREPHSSVKTHEYSIPCYCSTLEDKHLHFIRVPTPHHSTRKVFFVSSYFHNKNVKRALYSASPISNMNNIAYMIVNTDEEGKNVEFFCNSKLLKFVLFILTSKRDIPIHIIKSIRIPNILIYSSDELYKHFKLTDDEIKLIEETVK